MMPGIIKLPSGRIFAPCLVWQPQDSDGGDGRHCSPSPKSNESWRGSPLKWRLGEHCPDVRRRIGEALALRPDQGAIRALLVVDPELGAVVKPEVKFGEVTIKMLLIDVLVDADQPTLEHAEEAFERVHMHLAPDVLALGVVNGFVLSVRHDLTVGHGTVGNEAGVDIEFAPQRL